MYFLVTTSISFSVPAVTELHALSPPPAGQEVDKPLSPCSWLLRKWNKFFGGLSAGVGGLRATLRARNSS